MKKFLGILVLGLLWCNVGFAENEGSGPIKFPPGFEKRFSVNNAIDEICGMYKQGRIKDKDEFYTVNMMKKLKLDKS